MWRDIGGLKLIKSLMENYLAVLLDHNLRAGVSKLS